jgi:hypothetical protein
MSRFGSRRTAAAVLAAERRREIERGWDPALPKSDWLFASARIRTKRRLLAETGWLLAQPSFGQELSSSLGNTSLKCTHFSFSSQGNTSLKCIYRRSGLPFCLFLFAPRVNSLFETPFPFALIHVVISTSFRVLWLQRELWAEGEIVNLGRLSFPASRHTRILIIRILDRSLLNA